MQNWNRWGLSFSPSRHVFVSLVLCITFIIADNNTTVFFFTSNSTCRTFPAFHRICFLNYPMISHAEGKCYPMSLVSTF